MEEKEFEDICYICRRPESKAGRMFHLPNNICICDDCMHKTMDAVSQIDYQDMMNRQEIMAGRKLTRQAHRLAATVTQQAHGQMALLAAMAQQQQANRLAAMWREQALLAAMAQQQQAHRTATAMRAAQTGTIQLAAALTTS